MGDTPTGDDQERPDETSETTETSKLELPSLSLSRFGRKKKVRQGATSPVAGPEPSTPDAPPTDEAEPQPEPTREAEPTPEPEPEPLPVQDHPPVEPREEPAVREPLRLPRLSGRIAAPITGLVVGAFGAMLTFVSLQGCEAVRGTESCGGTGLLLLVVILILMVLLGGVLLAAWNVSDPRSTSFLAVGVLCVVVLLTLIEELFSPWMFLVVPVLSALCYLLSQWVTTTFIEVTPEKGPEHDVR